MLLVSLAASAPGCGGGEGSTCSPETCEAPRVCVEGTDGASACACPAGTHDEAGACVADTECLEGACSGHGTCSVVDTGTSCACDEGWAGAACERCAEGWHDDGAGGCTADPCTPDPCDPERVCVAVAGAAECRCPAGQHDEAGACVPDTTCMPSTCAGHGACAELDGRVSCTCDAGWTGAYCDACDEGAGYHDDGAGGCTTDACLPSPCTTVAHRTVCTPDELAGVVCLCEPGYHDDGAGGCALDETCSTSSCGAHGTCSDTGGIVSCACDLGWATSAGGGAACDACDAGGGYHDDGAGGCTDDVCLPNPCTEPSRSVCAPDGSGGATCACDPGTHDEAGACVADQTCTATSCNGHGACDASGGVVSCACDAGWAGTNCGACDGAAGYHDDGAGGCTTDLCLPNPCVAAHRGVCSSSGGSTSCACDAGYHDDAGACVADETCTATSCSGHGSCSVTGGVVGCACSAGWAGVHCDACAAGYHPDGAGGCTTDACLPNPCTGANRTVCTDIGGTASCACDAGYHEDGAGGCTTDPCRPDPCAALGQLCRDAGGTAECYTPVCNDGNPCTDDSFDGASCVHSARANGTSCSTSACTTGQTCTAGVCGGGSAVSCDDANPCTVDSCSATSGCAHAADDTLVPEDGVACTVDACAGGVASHAASSARCDDGLYCSGADACVPGDPGADARGCVVRDVPRAPGPNGPCGTWSCSEASHAFTLVAASAGSSCDDTVACTSGDACDGLGACRGTATAACSAGATDACASTTPIGSGVDVPAAHVSGALTFAGGPAVPSAHDDEVNVWLHSRSTGAYVHLEQIDFGSWDGARYPVASYDFRDDREIDLDVIPGVYDLVYERLWGTDATRDWGGSPDGTYPYGRQLLRASVVLGPGTNRLDVDIPAARVTGSLTFAGAPAVASANDDDVNVWLRNQATGALVHLEQIDFGSWDGTRYPVAGYDFRDDRAISLDVIPGVYDLIYERLWGTDPTRDWGGPPDGTYPYGQQVLATGIVLGTGTNTLNVDIPAARVTGSLTFGGAPAVGSANDDDVNVWLLQRATGAMVHLEQIDFGSWTGSQYPVASYDHRDDRVISLDVIPGTYDLVYERLWGTDPLRDWGGPPDHTYAYGRHVLRAGIVLGTGTNTLDVDIPAAHVTGTLTFAGGAAVPSANDDDVNVWLLNRATGAVVHLEQIDFGSWTGSQYPVASYDHRDDRAIDLDVIPGTYDLIYERLWGTDPLRDWGGPSDHTYAYGRHALRTGIVIAAGNTTLDVDIPAAHVTGTLTFAGGPAVASANDDDVNVWLRNQATGALVHLEQIDFGSWTGSQYPVASYDYRDDRAIDLDVIPGTYDVIYERLWGTDRERDWGGPADRTYPYGAQQLVGSVVIPAGASVLSVDIPRAALAGALTFAGAAAVASAHDDEVNVWLRSRATGALVHLEQIDFGSWDGMRYPVASYDYRDDRVIDLDVIPGVYDVVYQRLWGTDAQRDWGGSPDGTYAYGNTVLRACVVVP